MDLFIPLKQQSKTPLYEQAYTYIRDEIAAGRLGAGTRLPSTRRLSENLKVSRSTVQLAYDQLVSEGYLEARACRGYFVSGGDGMEALPVGPEGIAPGGGTPAGLPLEADGQESPGPEKSRWEVDFSPRGIDLEHFPFAVWRKLSRNALLDDRKGIFSSGPPQGQLDLRRAIAGYLHRARGVKCAPEQIVVGAGNEYLLMLLHQILGWRAAIAMESPTYMQAYRVLSGLGHPVELVDMDEWGMRIGPLEDSRAQAAYVMPSHNYPMGIVMPVSRRRQLLSWAGRADGRYIIEDDYDSEFRYRGKPIPALQGMDQDGKVIYLGTFSRAVAPAIRVSYMVLPPRLLKAYRERAGFLASTVSRLDQDVLFQFMEGGYFERHLNRMRTLYKAKHDCLLARLRPLEAVFSVEGDNAGTHLLLTHRAGRPEAELTALAEGAGVKVYGLSGFYPRKGDGGGSSTLLLGYAALPEREIVRGVDILTGAWS